MDLTRWTGVDKISLAILLLVSTCSMGVDPVILRARIVLGSNGPRIL